MREAGPPAAQPLRQVVNHIAFDELEPAFRAEMLQIVRAARLEIVDADDVRAVGNQTIAQIRADKARSPGHQYLSSSLIRHALLPSCRAMRSALGGQPFQPRNVVAVRAFAA